jgi:polysaccharide export outer membrane protein
MNTNMTLNQQDNHPFSSRWNCLAIVVAPLLLLVALIAGCSTETESYPPNYARLEMFPPSTNVLAQADIISITFRYSTNFNTVQKIGLDGIVNLEGVGQVKAEGKTLAQLQDELTALYKAQVKDDPITIKIIGPAAAVYVTGAVNRPGKVVMERRMTVMDAIAEAGGFDQYRARLSRVSVLRVDGDTQKIYWVDLNRVLAGEDTNPFFLKPYDVVRVPTKTFNF